MIEVERTIIEAFDEKIPPGVDIKLLISIHSTLVVLSLAPGQRGIDGTMLQRLYRNKPVYIRPNQQLLDLASHGIVQQVFYNIFSYVSINSMGAQPLPPPPPGGPNNATKSPRAYIDANASPLGDKI